MTPREHNSSPAHTEATGGTSPHYVAKTHFGLHVVAKAERRLLQVQIEDCKLATKRLQTDLFFAKRQLGCIAPDIFVNVQFVTNQEVHSREARHKSQNQKTQALLAEKGTASRAKPNFETRNLSSNKISPLEYKLFSRALNLNQGKAPDPQRVACAVEGAVRHLEQDVQDKFQVKTIGVLSRMKKPSSRRSLERDECLAIRSLQANKGIGILPAAKGNVTVTLDRSLYREKMEAMLPDETTYCRLPKDPTPKVQTSLQKNARRGFSGASPPL